MVPWNLHMTRKSVKQIKLIGIGLSSYSLIPNLYPCGVAQAGHSERALAVWQVAGEFHCFRPAEIERCSFEQRFLEMELFRSSGIPRFGQPEMSVEEPHSKWTSVAGKLTAIATTCEDALIGCSGKGIPDESYGNTGADVVPFILSPEVAADQWVRRGSIP
ncbi:hypothetical protein Smp_129160 [Schistosoma mansoni]|uniref:Oxidoreductase n=1 Tax=Schistosoma mansoni TaxID=6183 RepID=G4VEV8_SCHMA|nr:hypothetical protein Smp_129160 [Schistosoma mansoni]|eukprot:XP_018651077.1 hypothetical protein Smp_129160 [Schistosoma mansoni]